MVHKYSTYICLGIFLSLTSSVLGAEKKISNNLLNFDDFNTIVVKTHPDNPALCNALKSYEKNNDVNALEALAKLSEKEDPHPLVLGLLAELKKNKTTKDQDLRKKLIENKILHPTDYIDLYERTKTSKKSINILKEGCRLFNSMDYRWVTGKNYYYFHEDAFKLLRERAQKDQTDDFKNILDHLYECGLNAYWEGNVEKSKLYLQQAASYHHQPSKLELLNINKIFGDYAKEDFLLFLSVLKSEHNNDKRSHLLTTLSTFKANNSFIVKFLQNAWTHDFYTNNQLINTLKSLVKAKPSSIKWHKDSLIKKLEEKSELKPEDYYLLSLLYQGDTFQYVKGFRQQQLVQAEHYLSLAQESKKEYNETEHAKNLRISLALSYINNSDVAAALSIIQKLPEDFKQYKEFIQGLLVLKSKPEEGVRYLEKSADANPESLLWIAHAFINDPAKYPWSLTQHDVIEKLKHLKSDSCVENIYKECFLQLLQEHTSGIQAALFERFINKNHPDTDYCLGLIEKLNGKTDKALWFFERSLKSGYKKAAGQLAAILLSHDYNKKFLDEGLNYYKEYVLSLEGYNFFQIDHHLINLECIDALENDLCKKDFQAFKKIVASKIGMYTKNKSVLILHDAFRLIKKQLKLLEANNELSEDKLKSCRQLIEEIKKVGSNDPSSYLSLAKFYLFCACLHIKVIKNKKNTFEIKDYCARVDEYLEKSKGEDASIVACHYSTLAKLALLNDLLEEAEDYYVKSCKTTLTAKNSTALADFYFWFSKKGDDNVKKGLAVLEDALKKGIEDHYLTLGKYYAGRLKISAGELPVDYKKAEKYFLQAWQKGSIAAGLELAFIFLRNAQQDKKLVTAAEKLYKHILKKDPENVEALYLLAEIKHNQNNYKDSLSYFERAWDIKPINSEVNILIALSAHLELGNKVETIQKFEEFLFRSYAEQTEDVIQKISYDLWPKLEKINDERMQLLLCFFQYQFDDLSKINNIQIPNYNDIVLKRIVRFSNNEEIKAVAEVLHTAWQIKNQLAKIDQNPLYREILERLVSVFIEKLKNFKVVDNKFVDPIIHACVFDIDKHLCENLKDLYPAWSKMLIEKKIRPAFTVKFKVELNDGKNSNKN